ncbi:MAG: condensation domain-containing protein, partial [Candidatus Aminicenantes bacterium]|nr:condensation domain-containing protein [Candidatus Aminicenantes bacterium]
FSGKLYNVYGPTETTVWSTLAELPRDGETLTIGRPVLNTEIIIMDKDNNLVPRGVVGELCIGGEGVARGYLNRPELSAEKFKKYRSYRTNRTYILYKTGDLARWLPEGNIEFLGRIDQQIKIRGFRVELGEIETLLLKHDQIKDTVVVLKGDETTDKNLAAYFVSDIELSDTELREYLLKDLPEYMIPSYFVCIEKLPLTPNGKIDRRALPEPIVDNVKEYEAPRYDIEKKLVEIWSHVLGIEKEKIGINANFFRLGGHSLKTTSLASRIYKEFNVKIPLGEIFKRPTVRGLFDYINGAVGERYTRIEAAEEKEYYSLSYAQKRIYTALQLEVGSISYNMASILRLKGELDRERLQYAFRELVERHEGLRTSFEIVGNEPVQRVHDKVEFAVEYRSFGEGIAALKNYIRAFNLTRAPLLRVCLSRIEDQEYAMMMDISHLISDGVSFMLMAKDLMTLYNRQELPPLNIQYKDFSEWESRLFRTGHIKKQEDFWLDAFKGELPILELPTDSSRPDVRNVDAGAAISAALKESTKQKLDEIIGETDSTLFTILLAVYNVLLNKYSGQEDFVVGSVVTGRTHEDLENVIGVFINMLPLRNRPQPGKPFRNFLEEVKENTFRALENQDYPMEELVKKLGIRSNPGRHPLFDTEFAVNNIEFEQLAISDLKMERYDSGINFAKFDLHFLAIEQNNSLNLILRYSTELFKKTTAEKIIEHFIEITEQVVENPGIKPEDIEISIDFMSIKSSSLGKEQGDFNF